MKRLALLILLAGCHAQRPVQWAGIRDGMKLGDAVEALNDAGAEVHETRISSGGVLVDATMKDGSRATIPFTDSGNWRYISVLSPELTLADAQAWRTRVAAHLGPPPEQVVALNAEWSSDYQFHSRDDRSGRWGTVEGVGGKTGAVPIGPPGLKWGMTPREVRRAIEGASADDVEDDNYQLEFGGGADGSWLEATFDEKGHLSYVVYSTSPPLGTEAAKARLRALEAAVGPANTVEESDEWQWMRGYPTDSIIIRVVHVRGQATAHVEQLYIGVPMPRSRLPD